jgi:hypothetical protein
VILARDKEAYWFVSAHLIVWRNSINPIHSRKISLLTSGAERQRYAMLQKKQSTALQVHASPS